MAMFKIAVMAIMGAQVGFLDKGKPVVRPGRKATGLVGDRRAAERMFSGPQLD